MEASASEVTPLLSADGLDLGRRYGQGMTEAERDEEREEERSSERVKRQSLIGEILEQTREIVRLRSEVESLRRRGDCDSDGIEVCIICLDANREVAYLPCGHFTCCIACGGSMETCPVCRRDVDRTVRIYW